MDPYILTFKETANLRMLDEYDVKDVPVTKHLPYIVFSNLTEEQKELLKNENDILSIERDMADDFEEEEGQTESYAIDLLEVKKYHEKGYKGQGIKIAVFDSGVQK